MSWKIACFYAWFTHSNVTLLPCILFCFSIHHLERIFNEPVRHNIRHVASFASQYRQLLKNWRHCCACNHLEYLATTALWRRTLSCIIHEFIEKDVKWSRVSSPWINDLRNGFVKVLYILLIYLTSKPNLCAQFGFIKFRIIIKVPFIKRRLSHLYLLKLLIKLITEPRVLGASMDDIYSQINCSCLFYFLLN